MDDIPIQTITMQDGGKGLENKLKETDYELRQAHRWL